MRRTLLDWRFYPAFRTDRALRDALPDARLDYPIGDGAVELEWTLRDMPRPLAMHEVSGGTLAWLCLVAALCGYRLPVFVALNEPEANLHTDLVEPPRRR